jgi:succinoglycan biosynthesis transport protein ExoP
MDEQQGLIRKKPDLSDLDEALELAAAQLGGGGDYPGYPAAGKVQFGEYWRAVRQRLWLVIGITLTVTVLVALYMARKQDVYTAQARVQVNNENSQSGGVKGNQVIYSYPMADPNYFNTQMQILTGPGLLRRVAKTLDLEHNRDFFSRPESQTTSTWQNLLRMFNLGGRNPKTAPVVADNSLETKSIAPASAREDLAEAEKLQPYVDYLQGSLKVERVVDTRLIDLGFTHADPAIASKVVNTIADVFVLSNLEKQTDTNANQADAMDKRIAELQTEVRNGEERLLNYAKNNQVVSFEGRENTAVERFVALNQQLIQAESDRKAAEAALQAASAPGAAAAQVAAARSAQAEGTIAQLRQRRAQLLAKTTEEWPEVKEIDRQIAELQNQMAESKNQNVTTLLTNLRTAYNQALAREQSIRSAFDQQKTETLNQNQAAINYRILQQEVNTNKALLESMLVSSKENDLVRAGTSNNIRVVDYAVKPRSPVGVNRLMGVMVAFPLSLIFGISLALLLDFFDDTIKSEHDVERYFRLPTMGVIPSLQSLKHLRKIGDKSSTSLGLAKRNGNETFRIVLTDEPRSPLAEAYRHLRTSLLLSSIGGPPKVILVTSTLPSEGKTTTATNLAVTLAQGGADVLLIDGDLRRPCLHTVFNLDNERGLSTIISSNTSGDNVQDLIAHDEQSRLSVLTSGPMPPNPADHLGSEKMRLLLKTFGSTYKHVVIDSPPLSSFTDGILLATMADSVLFVMQGRRASRETIRRASRMLNDVGVSITGVVLNNVPLTHDDRYYQYQQYYKEVDAMNGTNGTNGTNGSNGHDGSNGMKGTITN